MVTVTALVEPSFGLPRRKYFTTHVLKSMYDKTRAKVNRELKSALGICLTTDNWSSDSNQAYITVTAHITASNYEEKNFVFETIDFTRNHTADRIVQHLQDLAIEWSIFDKIICLVSDNCATMVKVGRDFNKGVPERQLIFDVCTRWNSTFYMIEKLTEEKPSVLLCLSEQQFQKNLTKAGLSTIINWEVQAQLKIFGGRILHFLSPSLYDKHPATKSTLQKLQAFNAKNEAYDLLLKKYEDLLPKMPTSSIEDEKIAFFRIISMR
ncbi:unnamed protein product [Didymodactylos carnosus]|uniref:Uncharacterized protein n=1 Tax=Didymodactylos carnosus TaxID=1234261 RepID=A0A814S0F8_9BILA|nr:unnamed protein product [Didymodactylos carnosus]CAF1141509.1 unnamed protein product [Didymodactylos carnosus]CAF3736768.1 unnamed protein product [Didymodactylos carnosus]CAF3905221.1 unnamed protein product [Didymodactylos carnosus]